MEMGRESGVHEPMRARPFGGASAFTAPSDSPGKR